MSVDNRVFLNDCEDDAQTFTTTGGALGTNILAGNLIQGAASVQFQHSDAYEDTTTTGDSAGATYSINMSARTFYLNVKDNGIDLTAVAGAEIVLGDGTDRIGYTVGGSDAVGMPYAKQFLAFKLDGSDAAANPGTADVDHHVYAGTEAALDFTAITTSGWGTLHSAKAQGNVVNTWLDGLYHIANGSYALTVNLGSSGTPITMPDIIIDDEAAGRGLVANPLGSQYMFFGPTEWGDASTGAITAFADAGGGSTTVTSATHGMVNGTTVVITGTTSYNGTFTTAAVATNTFDIVRAFVADDATGTFGASAYFTASDEQWYWMGDNSGGRAIGATNFPFQIQSNATGVTDIKWSSVVIINTGTRSQFLAGDANTDVMQFDAVTLTDLGTIDFPAQSAGNRFVNNSIFNNCDQTTFSSIDADSCTFNGTTDANGAVLWSTTVADVANQDNFSYNSDGTGHAIEIALNTASTTTYNISGYDFDGYAYDDGTAGNRIFFIDNLLDGDVNINLTNSTAVNQSSGTAGIFSHEKAAGYTGVVTIQQTVTLTLTGIETDSEVRIVNLDDTTNFNKELDGAEQISGTVQTATLVNAGTGYVATNVLTVTGGTGTAATITVDTVGGGGEILTFTVTGVGSYTANPPNPASVTGGAGSNATFRLDISGEHAFVYDGGLGVNVAIIVFHLNFRDVRIEQIIPSVTSSIPIQQSTDRTYNNP